MKKNTVKKGLMPYLLLIIATLFIVFSTGLFGGKINILSYSEFEKNLKEGKITELKLVPRGSASIYEVTGKLDGYKENETFYAKLPLSETIMERIIAEKDKKNFEINAESDPDASALLQFAINVLPMIILVGGALYFFSRQMGSSSKSLDFGKSRAKLSEDNGKVTFKDVAGLIEEKEEVAELIDFLKNPKKFQKLGARIPKGVLLVGPPGTGKTLLAKAVAGEANVPFYFISGSDFVELFVGIGASRVRDMFKQAKHSAPCLIFIDEIDAVGRQRGTGLGGGHDEREQTLNQLLTEMDGFGANEGIIIIAATNRPDVLDPALLRPGRFDRQVTIPAPDLAGREDILKIHAKDKKIADDVSLYSIAEDTAGFTGAELANILNEAAIIATKKEHDAITNQDLDEAVKKVTVGLEKTSRKISDKDKKLTAYHEAGHAIVSQFLPTQTAVKEVSIIPRGMAGGYTMYKSDEDKYYISKTEMQEKLIALLGGRAAEKLILDDISTGASNDLEVATQIARDMITVYGMSDTIGTISFKDSDGEMNYQMFGDEMQDAIGKEVKRLIDTAYRDAQEILRQNIDKLHAIASVLITKEKINEEEFNKFFNS